MTESSNEPVVKHTHITCKLCGRPNPKVWTVVLADDEILNQEHLMGDLAPHFWVDVCARCFYLVRGIFAEHQGQLSIDLKRFKEIRGKY
jgi:hypothetical protein